MGVEELEARLKFLEHENAELRRALEIERELEEVRTPTT